ncbi:MAG: hypothetical protein WDZ59_07710 [Pirellulales bacterium]
MNEDSLDNQIREALRVEAKTEQVSRLEAFWEAELHRQRQKRTVRRSLALAASLLVAVSIVGWASRHDLGGQDVVEAPQPAVQTAPPAIRPSPETPQIDVDVPAPSIGREPTALEQLVFYSHSPRGVDRANESLASVVDDLIEQVQTGQADPQSAVDDAAVSTAEIERELLRRLVRSKDGEKLTLMKILAAGGSMKSMPALLRVSRSAAHRDEALATIEQIVGPEGLARVVRQASNPQVRMILMQRMLADGSDESVAAFLSLVQDPARRAEAFSAAGSANSFPTETLFALLRSDDQRIRLSAALVLGHVNGPDITRKLVVLVSAEQSAPTEAWMALLACRGELAEKFLNYATGRPQLLGHVNQARVQWARMNL